MVKVQFSLINNENAGMHSIENMILKLELASSRQRVLKPKKKPKSI